MPRGMLALRTRVCHAASVRLAEDSVGRSDPFRLVVNKDMHPLRDRAYWPGKICVTVERAERQIRARCLLAMRLRLPTATSQLPCRLHLPHRGY